MLKTENWIKEIEKEYGSLEEYIRISDEGGAEPLLLGVSPFHYLWKKRLLVEDDIIRTNLEGGLRDGHYSITAEGKLEGIEAAQGIYSGNKGIHPPEKILSLKKADNGWTLGLFAKIRISNTS